MHLTTCDGRILKRMLVAGGHWLSLHRSVLNDLNVFPVPDGDTGTNLSLTMRGALAPLLARRTPEPVGEVAQAAARGALMGARGNSGVIFSQILHGFAHSLEGRTQAGTRQLAEALEGSCQAAYSSIQQPREGTILTVIRETAARARAISTQHEDLGGFFRVLAEHSRQVLTECRDQLPILKEAGVVDAGGLGLVYILEGMRRVILGEPLTAPPELARYQGPTHQSLEQDIVFRYCTEFLVEGTALAPADLRPQLEELGDSLVVARASDLLKVHIHTNEPDRVEALVTPGCRSFRRKVEDMRAQNEHRREGHARGITPAQQEAASAAFQGDLHLLEPPSPSEAAGRGLPPMVAIATGEGVVEYLQAWGAEIVPGGQTLNPSIGEILAAIERAGGGEGEVWVLPNNPNCAAAAAQAARLSARPARVLPTRCPSQAVCLLSKGALMDPVGRVSEMAHGEVTRAVKDATVEGRSVRRGDYLALWGGRLVGLGGSFQEAVLCLMERPPRTGFTRLVLVAGQESEPDEVEDLLLRILERHPEARLEFLWGGQPHHPALIALE